MVAPLPWLSQLASLREPCSFMLLTYPTFSSKLLSQYSLFILSSSRFYVKKKGCAASICPGLPPSWQRLRGSLPSPPLPLAHLIPVFASPSEEPHATSHVFPPTFTVSIVTEQKEVIHQALAEPNPKHGELRWRKVVYVVMNGTTHSQGNGKLMLKSPNSPIQGSEWVSKGFEGATVQMRWLTSFIGGP